MRLSKMDYTAHVNNFAFLEVLNVLLAMATCTQKTQKTFCLFPKCFFSYNFFLDKKKQQINKKKTNKAKQGTYRKLIKKINRSLSCKYCYRKYFRAQSQYLSLHYNCNHRKIGTETRPASSWRGNHDMQPQPNSIRACNMSLPP